MAWWDVRRRRDRAADIASAAPSGASGPGPAGSEPSRAASAMPGGSLPGDWDGGWRRVAAPSLTVARAPLGVSDGLTFRDGLTSWQNPAFDSGLGHGLLPSAPMGLVHGVTRPAVQRSEYGSGGPLLLRSLPEPGGEEAGDGADSALAQVQRVVRADGRGAGEVRRPTAKSARSQAVSPSPGAERAVADGAGRVTGPELPVVRRVAVVPNAPGAGTTRRSTAVEPGRAGAVRPRPLGPSLTAARRVATGPVRRVTAVRPVPAAGVEAGAGVAGAAAVQRASAPGRAPGRASLGAPITELPSTAAPLAVDGPPPSRSVTAAAPSSSGPVLPVVQRRVDAPETGAGEAVAAPRVVAADGRTDAGAQAPAVQRRADGSGSGPADTRAASKPLLPEVRRHVDAAADKAPETPLPTEVQPSADPVLPVVQRQAEAPVPTGNELPAAGAQKPSRDVTPAASRPLLPEVQRLVDTPGSAGNASPAAPGLPATGTPGASGTAGTQPPAGPALPVVQRRTDTADTTPAEARPGSEPEPSVVQRAADSSEAARPTAKPLLPGAQHRVNAPAPAGGELPAVHGPVLPVVQRQVEAPGTEVPAKPLLSAVQRQVDASGSAEKERPATAPRPAAAEPTPGPVLPVVQRQTDASALPGSSTTPTRHPGSSTTPTTHPGSSTGPTTRPGAGPAASEGPAPSRRTERTGPSGARARGGLGAPLSALPPTAAPGGPVGAGGRPAQPYVQRVAAGQEALRASMAPLLGTAATGRPATTTNSPAPTPTSAPSEGPAAATPLVTRAVAQPGPSATDAPGVVQRAASTGPTKTEPAKPGPAQPGPTQPGRTQPGPAQPGRRTNTGRPVVVARALAEPRRTVRATARSLLSARPLTLNTRAPEGMPRPPHADSPGTPAKPPVVAASWRREPTPEAVQPAAPGAPPVQRVVSTRPRLPVVRPDTTVQRAAAGAALPLTEAQAPPLQAAPSPASLTPPGGLPVPVVRMTRPVEPTPVVPGGVQVDVVQRDAKEAAGGTSARTRPRSVSAPASFPASGTTDGKKEAAPQDPGVDLEDLARRLLDPLARLLRADMRRGRERAGRPYDGRR
ncbi:hypothetical protein ACTAF0_22605 [Streptomyces murinus]|uniref:hypothetical protein n=1 Tax=Streptomyces murinus TaxID=33900 RepID=UPI003F466CD5